MKQFTCRTEAPHCDNHRAVVMFQQMGITVELNNEGNITFECGKPRNTLQIEMFALQEQKQFADLHRTWQTLQEGNQPNEQWFKENFDHVII